MQPHPRSTLFPYTTLFRSDIQSDGEWRASWSLTTKKGSARSCDRCSSTRGTTSASPAVVAKRSSCTRRRARISRSEEHTSELQSRLHLVCRLLLEKKKNR